MVMDDMKVLIWTKTSLTNGLGINIALNTNYGDMNAYNIRQQDDYELFVCYGCYGNEESCLNN